MAHSNYDPSQHVLYWNGIYVTGFMEGTFISAERNEDGFTLVVGATGESARARNLNRSGLVTATLMQTAASHQLLMAAYSQDEFTGLNSGPLILKNALSGLVVVRAKDAWVRKLPTEEFAKEVTGREWQFECADLRFYS